MCNLTSARVESWESSKEGGKARDGREGSMDGWIDWESIADGNGYAHEEEKRERNFCKANDKERGSAKTRKDSHAERLDVSET